MIYLDYAANHPSTLKVDLGPDCHNISNSLYSEAKECKKRLKRLEEKFHNFPANYIFTSGASESIATALHDVFIKNLNEKEKIHVCCSAIEHGSIQEALKFYESFWDITYIQPMHRMLEYEDFKPYIKSNTKLVILMAVNNELGNINSYSRFPDKKKRNYAILSDCTQLFGKVKDLSKLLKKVDYVTGSFHKIGGRKGSGVLIYTNPTLTPLIFGKQGLRGGTIDHETLIYNLSVYLEYKYNFTTYAKMREYLVKKLQKMFPEIIINTSLKHSLPSILNFSLPSQCALKVIKQLNQEDENGNRFIIGIGSACNSGQENHVLKSYNIKYPNSTFRVSFGSNTKLNDLKKFANRLNNIIR